MSFTKPNWDKCTYETTLSQSTDAASYGIKTPRHHCNACAPPVADPLINHYQRGFPNGLIDVDSQLRSLNHQYSRCPSDKYWTDKDTTTSLTTQPCEETTHYTETTRFSNPPCTLRGTGWNRWEWLCQNPQDQAIPSFDTGVSSRIVMKDNHRPLVEPLVDQTQVLPPGTNDAVVVAYNIDECKSEAAMYPSTQWRSDAYYKQFLS